MNDVPLDHNKNAAEVLHADCDLAVFVLLQTYLTKLVQICGYLFVYDVNVSLEVNTLFCCFSLAFGRVSFWWLRQLRSY